MRGVKGFIAGTLVSRVLGLIREAFIAYLLGAKDAADAFYVALRVPMILRDMVAENVVQTAFVPSFIEAKERFKTPETFLSAVLVVGGVGLGLITVLGVLAAPWLVKLTAWGFSGQKLALASHLTRLMFPLVLLVSASALASGLLNTKKRFFVPSLSPAFFNMGIVSAGAMAAWVLRSSPTLSATALAAGVLVGGAGQILFQMPFLRGFKLKKPDFKHPSLKSLKKLLLPVLVSTGFSRLTLVVNTIIASFLGTGAVAYLNYAFRMMQLPLGLFGVGVATVALPAMAEKAAKKQDATQDLGVAEAMSFFLNAPATVFMIFAAQPIIALIFSRGSFGLADSYKAASALVFYAIAVPAISLSRVYLNYLFANKRVREPNISFGIAAGVNITLSLALAPLMGFPGLALATGIASWVQTLFLRSVVASDKWNWRLGLMLGLSLACFGAAWLLLSGFNTWVQVFGEMITGSALYLLSTRLVGMRYLGLLFARSPETSPEESV